MGAFSVLYSSAEHSWPFRGVTVKRVRARKEEEKLFRVQFKDTGLFRAGIFSFFLAVRSAAWAAFLPLLFVFRLRAVTRTAGCAAGCIGSSLGGRGRRHCTSCGGHKQSPG